MPPEYDPSNVEHVTRLATALGFTDVIIVIGQPGLTANGWRATYRGQRFACEAPHLFKQTTDEARKILARISIAASWRWSRADG